MAWTTPITWTAGQVVGASDFNAHIRDNELFLFSGRLLGNYSASPAFATTSTTFVTVNTSTCRLSITTSHANARVLIVGYVVTHNTNASASLATFDLLIDSATYISGSSSGIGLTNGGSSAAFALAPITYSIVLTFASAGAHTVDLVVRALAAGTYTVDVAQSWALEVA